MEKDEFFCQIAMRNLIQNSSQFPLFLATILFAKSAKMRNIKLTHYSFTIYFFWIFRVRWHKSQIMGYSSQRLYFYLQRPQWDRYLPQIQPRRPMGGLWWRRRCSQGQYIRTLKMRLISRLQRMLFSVNPIPTRQGYFLSLW